MIGSRFLDYCSVHALRFAVVEYVKPEGERLNVIEVKCEMRMKRLGEAQLTIIVLIIIAATTARSSS